VQSPEEFSKKYLVDLTKSGLAKKEVDKLLKDGSISQRIIYIINK
jgi:hypothetical protein